MSALVFLAAGCGEKKTHAENHRDHDHAADGEHSEHGDEEEGKREGVHFEEGRGLQLSPEVVKALGLTTAEAIARPLSSELSLTA